MGHNEECLTTCGAEIRDDTVYLFAVVGIERPGRFVGKYNARTVDKRPGYGHTLFFAARQFRRTMPQTVAESKNVEQVTGFFGNLPASTPPYKPRYRDILKSRKLRQ